MSKLSHAAHDALMFAGVAPPPAHSTKTQCPRCSPRRKKKMERCMQVRETLFDVTAHCFHCGEFMEIEK